jgi:hypothetical protein
MAPEVVVALITAGAALTVSLISFPLNHLISQRARRTQTLDLMGRYRPVVPARRFADPLFGWTIRLPAGLTARHFQIPCLHSPIAGVRVTNFPPNLRAPSTVALGMGWLRSFPADGVAVQIGYGCGLPFPPPLQHSAFPLSPSSFHRIRPYVGGKEPHPWYCGCYGDGIAFGATVWLGPHASPAERQAAWAVVRSLRFRALREGRSIRRCGRAGSMRTPTTCSARLRGIRRDRSQRPGRVPAGQPWDSGPRPGRLLPDPCPPRLLRHPPAVPAACEAVHQVHAGV